MSAAVTHRDWQQTYRDKVSTAKDAICDLRPGRRILIGSGAAEPVSLVEGLIEHGGHLSDVEVVHLLTLGPAPYVKPEFSQRFRHTAFFIGANVRQAVAEGRADFMPVFLSEIPALIRSRRVRVDVALIQVSEPDRHGFVSLGVSVDIVRAAVDSADLVIAEVNPHMPRTYGDSFLPVERIKHLVPVDYLLPERDVDADAARADERRDLGEEDRHEVGAALGDGLAHVGADEEGRVAEAGLHSLLDVRGFSEREEVDDLVVREVTAVHAEGLREDVRLRGARADQDAAPARDACDRGLRGGDLGLVSLSPVEGRCHGGRFIANP